MGTEVSYLIDGERVGLEEYNRRKAAQDKPIMVYVTIGNSDNKLTQEEWVGLIGVVRYWTNRLAEHVHGQWYSEPASVYQNANFGFEIRREHMPELKSLLKQACVDFKQDSIVWAEAHVEMVTPDAG
jgi:hypothetical protein